MFPIRVFCITISYFVCINLSCQVTKSLKNSSIFSKRILYSGVNNFCDELPKDIVVRNCYNCDVIFRDSQKRIKPLSPGYCKVIYESSKNIIDTLIWNVQQMPTPSFVFTPKLHGIQPDSVFFLRLTFEHLEKGEFLKYNIPLEINEPIISLYSIDMFEMEIINSNKVNIYNDFMFDEKLNCNSTLAIINNRNRNCEIVIKNLDVQMPDGSHSLLEPDTIPIK